MRFRLFLSVVSLLALCLTGSFTHAQEPLTLAVHPYLPSTELIRRFTPLADYLGREIGRPVIIEISRDYETHVEMTGKNQVDLAFMGPASYVELVERYGRKPILARLEINGKPTFRGVIITAKDSLLKTLGELKGKRFAFGDPNSTMSHLVPRYMMLKAGVKAEDLSGYVFLHNHYNVVLGVLAGDFAAGAVKDEVFYEYEGRGLRALVWTPPVSHHLFVASSTLPKRTIGALREAMYRLREEKDGPAILSGIEKGATGMVPAVDGDYENLRVILRALEKAGVQP
ncbi:MAG: phosphate/phosphite/phosphonate ABC transporter substrate-binding protein [bacterium]